MITILFTMSSAPLSSFTDKLSVSQILKLKCAVEIEFGSLQNVGLEETGLRTRRRIQHNEKALKTIGRTNDSVKET